MALWCKNQIEHSIWDESLLLSNCACSLEYSSLSTLAGLSYHICGKLEVAFKASPSSQHQHCTDEAQKAETVLSAVIYIYIYIYNFFFLVVGLFCSQNKHSMKGDLPKSLIVYTYIRFQIFSTFSDCFILMHYFQNIKIN